MQIVYKAGVGEIVEKKSRFIATVRPVTSEEEATKFINEMKKQYWDARHNCSAFVIGDNNEISRCSDDGEPSQTAGRPMLDVLLNEDVHNVAVVVTRYFGGVLLGTGGLVRAYQKAVKEGLNNSVLITKAKGVLYEIGTDYNGLGKLQYYFAQNNITIVNSIYEADVKLEIIIPIDQEEKIIKGAIETTNGTVKYNKVQELDYAIVDSELIRL
ncbi:YigZ family protein [Lachnobacterium bovis]|uniref:Uncharacterized protein, YigZ family n=1 Tax=Lachnobacterium bovis TaxID=140626 RepID=A0A1H9P3J2_9FIRM|nr:YigZ family protein [Lachnobacterium bovis]SER42163.1 uncharacterized protein, YigZ family [Lachnobacterium bovis]